MKKIRLILVCCILAIALCSCGSTKKASEDDLFVTLSSSAKDNMQSLSPSNIKQLDGNVLAKRITFENTAILLSVDNEENNTLSICGKYLKKDNLLLLEQRVRELVTGISLYSKDDLIVSSDSLEWSFKKVTRGIDFTITAKVNKEFKDTKPIQITRLAFQAGKSEFVKECDCFYIVPYDWSEEQTQVVKSPNAPKQKIHKQSNLKFTYYISSNCITKAKDVEAEIMLPDNCNDYIEIDHVTVKRDDNELKALRKETSIDQSLLQGDKVRVYSVTVHCKIVKGFRVTLKPLIKLNIAGQEHFVSPRTVLDLHID